MNDYIFGSVFFRICILGSKLTEIIFVEERLSSLAFFTNIHKTQFIDSDELMKRVSFQNRLSHFLSTAQILFKNTSKTLICNICIVFNQPIFFTAAFLIAHLCYEKNETARPFARLPIHDHEDFIFLTALFLRNTFYKQNK